MFMVAEKGKFRKNKNGTQFFKYMSNWFTDVSHGINDKYLKYLFQNSVLNEVDKKLHTKFILYFKFTYNDILQFADVLLKAANYIFCYMIINSKNFPSFVLMMFLFYLDIIWPEW